MDSASETTSPRPSVAAMSPRRHPLRNASSLCGPPRLWHSTRAMTAASESSIISAIGHLLCSARPCTYTSARTAPEIPLGQTGPMAETGAFDDLVLRLERVREKLDVLPPGQPATL